MQDSSLKLCITLNVVSDVALKHRRGSLVGTLCIVCIVSLLRVIMCTGYSYQHTKGSVAGHARLCIAWIRCGSFDGCTLCAMSVYGFLVRMRTWDYSLLRAKGCQRVD